MGWVYTLHLDPPYRGSDRQHADHYTGWAKDLRARLEEHESGGPDAANLLQHQKKAGGTWRLAAVERGTRDREIQLKYRGGSRRCPICQAAAAGLPSPAPIRLEDLQNFPEAKPLVRRTPKAGAKPVDGRGGRGSPVYQGELPDFPVANPLADGAPSRRAAPAAGRAGSTARQAPRAQAR
jgi:hypothetical protein